MSNRKEIDEVLKGKSSESSEKVTEIVFILDRSGSMNSIKSDAIGGFNSFIQEQKKLEGKTNLTLILFNDTVETVIDRVDINEVEELNESTYGTYGMTALLDGIGLGIDNLTNRLSRFKKDRESIGDVIFAIMTDGAENSSQEYTVERIRTKIEEATKEKDWQFIFLGANIDAVGTARNLGINPNFAGQFMATGDGGSRAILHASEMVTSYRMNGKMDSYDIGVDLAKLDKPEITLSIDTIGGLVEDSGNKIGEALWKIQEELRDKR